MYIVYKHNIAAKQKHDIYYTHTHTHNHTQTHTQASTHTQTISLSLSLSLTHTDTHSLSNTHFLTPPPTFRDPLRRLSVFSLGPTLFGPDRTRLSKVNIMKVLGRLNIQCPPLKRITLGQQKKLYTNCIGLVQSWLIRIF